MPLTLSPHLRMRLMQHVLTFAERAQRWAERMERRGETALERLARGKALMAQLQNELASPELGYPPAEGTLLRVPANLQELYALPDVVTCRPIGCIRRTPDSHVELLRHPWSPSYDALARLHATVEDGLYIHTYFAEGGGIGIMRAPDGALWLGRFADCAHDGPSWRPKDADHYRARRHPLPWETETP